MLRHHVSKATLMPNYAQPGLARHWVMFGEDSVQYMSSPACAQGRASVLAILPQHARSQARMGEQLFA